MVIQTYNKFIIIQKRRHETMKKRISMILALLLMLGLCACDSESGINSPAPNGGNNSGETAQSKTITVYVTINPEFSLTLDGKMTILAVEAVNEDAETLFAELDVTGKSYDEGMCLVLNAAYDQGFLKDGGQVTFTVNMDDLSTEVNDALSAPIAAFEQEKGIQTDSSLSLQVDELPEGVTTTQIDGQTVYIDKQTNESGTAYYYYKKKEPSPGDCIKIVTQWNPGWNDGALTTEYFEGVFMTKMTFAYPDGSYAIEECENGMPVKWTYTGSDGSYTIEEYENGNRIYMESKLSSGTVVYDTYYTNGSLATRKYIFADGICRDEHFNPDGSYQYYSDSYAGGQEFWFSGGKMTKAVVDGVTYTDAESLSHYAAGFGITQ